MVWQPCLPRIHSHRARRKFQDAYEAARDSFLAEVASVLGVDNVALLGEIDADDGTPDPVGKNFHDTDDSPAEALREVVQTCRDLGAAVVLVQ